MSESQLWDKRRPGGRLHVVRVSVVFVVGELEAEMIRDM